MSAPLPVALAEPAGLAQSGLAQSGRVQSGRAGRLRRWRAPVAVGAAVLGAAVVGLALVRPAGGGYLDPGSVAPDGARALVRVLRTHGVPVSVRTRFADVARDLGDAGPGGATVLLARPDLLLGERTQDLRRSVEDAGADLVLVGAGPALLADFQLPVVGQPTGEPASVIDPQCADLVAARAGSALAGEIAYRPVAAGPVTSCYPVDRGAAYVSITGAGGGRTTVLGSGAALTNERLADAGDAALAVGTLGARPRLIWYVPNPADTGVGTAPTLRELLPRGVLWATGQLAVALAVAIAWRARRLGRLVPEPLPVVVRSVETTLGRARLYRRARARGRAAQVLRAAAVQRIAVRCHLPRTADPHEVAVAAAARTRRPVVDVTAVLIGPDPDDDNALVALARAIDALDAEVRHP